MQVDVFKVTSDDWCGSYAIDGWHKGALRQMLVIVSFCMTGPKPPHDGDWRVCVWGNDDCGMEKDFKDERTAWCCYLEIIGLEDVTMTAIKERGFIST